MTVTLQIFWYQGKLQDSGTLELRIDDPGLIYGATVFTTLRVYGGSLDHPRTNWIAHCDRLKHSLNIFGWAEPDWQQIREGAEAMIPHWSVLRVTIFPDGRELIMGRSLPADLAEKQQQGISVVVWDAPQFRRSLPDHKTGNYLACWLALQGAKQQGADDAILVDDRGRWLETSIGNLWGWRDGHWWTPPLPAGILPGLMRSQLIDWLTSQGELVQEQPWTADLIRGFEAMAMSNSVMELVPIREVRAGSEILRYPDHGAVWSRFRRFLPTTI
ncbi:aminotransferase class IV [Planktothricoides raciborskii]|uniref:aminotransferase class IV n=1 Tax=Planktothricoides raciborskii TaxID=132608 RepID=UPI0028BEE585|nr:aminotransferase class IV [Planktothricoides raciborskii]